MASNGGKAACMDVQQLRRGRRSDGPAAVLAIGTANPENWVDQSTYADYYFDVSNSQHMTELKSKFQRICDKSQIRKRHLTHTGEMLAKHPAMTEYMGQSFDERQSIVIREVPRLGAEAAERALAEWGRPRTEITHMVVCATNGIDMPGTDFALLKMLGLRPGVRRVMMYQQGCFAGGTALRVAKDMAENNGGARVLLVCSEVTAMIFRGPSEPDMSSMVGQAIFADGAAALIVGADPHTALGERAVFEVVHAAQTVLPDSNNAVGGQLTEAGLTFHLRKDLPALVGKHIEACLREAFAEGLGLEEAEMPEWNELFWAVHPGGPAILDGVEAQLGLHGDKLAATRHVLREYGNMSSACVLFILDELRRKSKNALAPRPRLGALLGFGPGLTVEAVLLRSVPDPCPTPVS